MYKKPIIDLRQFIQQRSELPNYYTVKYIRCVSYYMAINYWLAVLSIRKANYYQTHYIKHIIYNQVVPLFYFSANKLCANNKANNNYYQCDR